MFFLLVFFRRPHYILKKIVQFLYFVVSLTFQEMCPMFFYLDALNNFSKNSLNVFA